MSQDANTATQSERHASDVPSSSTVSSASPIASELEQARALVESNKLEDADRLLWDILRRGPNNAQALFLLAVSRFRASQYPAAEKLLHAALLADDSHKKAHYYLALVRERRGDLAGAARSLGFCLALDGNFEPAIRKLPNLTQRSHLPHPPDAQPHPAAAPVMNTAPSVLTVSPVATALTSPPAPATTAVSTSPNATADIPDRPPHPHPAASRPAVGNDPSPIAAGACLTTRPLRRRMRSFGLLFPLACIAMPLSLVLLVAAIVVTNKKDESFGMLILGALACAAIVVTLFLKSLTTTYVFYEHRIDFQSGVLFRRYQSLWTYNITDIMLERSPMNLVTGDSRIVLIVSGDHGIRARNLLPGHFVVTGIGNVAYMQRCFEELRDAAIGQRRRIKGVFV